MNWQVLALSLLGIIPMLMLAAFVMGLAVAEWLYERGGGGGQNKSARRAS